MKHVPVYCPDYPDGLLYKHTPIYWKGSHQSAESGGPKSRDRKEDDFEKTRSVLIANSAIFSSLQNKDRHKKRKIAMLDIDVDRLPTKRFKVSDKMENDEEDGVEILENKYANMK